MLELSYVLLFIILWSVIQMVFNHAMIKVGLNQRLRKKRIIISNIVILLWFGIQYLVSESKFYHNLDFPPRIPIFMILPLLFFTLAFLNKNRNSPILHAIPRSIPIIYQSFRALIEVLFYLTFLKGILPVQVTFEGANYDVILGFSAILVFIYSLRKNASIKILIAWNIVGILVVAFAAFIFISSFYFPEVWGQTESQITLGFNRFPFLLLPLFFMPSAIFVHILSIIQLLNKPE